jgi:WD40 repeat protein
VREFEEHSHVSVDITLLARRADDFTAWIWNLDTGKLVAGPFKSMGMVSAVQFSTDSKKLTLKSDVGKCVEVWDIESQKFDVRVGGHIVKWQKAHTHRCTGHDTIAAYQPRMDPNSKPRRPEIHGPYRSVSSELRRERILHRW